MHVLEINNLHKSFASTFTGTSGKAETETAEVLKGVSISLKPATVTALIGSNGSGKSTLFNVISGLLRADKGKITFYYGGKSYNLNKTPSHRLAGIGIARLFQGNNIFPGLSVLDNMLVADNNRMGEQAWQALFYFKKTRKAELKRVSEAESILLELLGEGNPLWEKRHDSAGSLSLGQQRLLAFARLFMNEKAALFLLDEPCAGVNESIREKMTEMIHALKTNGKTVLLIEHNMDFARRTAEDAYYLEDGKVSIFGKINDVLMHEHVRENYLGEKNGIA